MFLLICTIDSSKNLVLKVVQSIYEKYYSHAISKKKKKRRIFRVSPQVRVEFQRLSLKIEKISLPRKVLFYLISSIRIP